MNTRMIAACELPIYARAKKQYEHLWYINNARDFCKQLLNLAAVPTITIQEYNGIAAVANGAMWPVPKTMYTMNDWGRDGSFNAIAGQEIEDEIYSRMLNVLPPLSLPRHPRTEGYSAGFLVSEPVCSDPAGHGMLYSAYGRKDGRCYYIGLLPHA